MRDTIMDLQSLCDFGHSRRDVARISGLTIGQLNYRLAKAIPPKPRRRKSALMRPCLCCQTTFNSEGPHNRLCDTCRRQRLTAFDYSPNS
jgi:hypothetical protein